MRVSDFFASPFVKGEDFEVKGPQILTIKSVDVEEVGKEKEKKPVVHFRDEVKAWVLNKTNWKTIEKAYGPTEDWPGKRIELFAAHVQFGDEEVVAVRCRIPKSPPKAPIDDSIPF